MFSYNAETNVPAAILLATAVTLSGATILTPQYSGSISAYLTPAKQFIKRVEDMNSYYNSSEVDRLLATVESYNLSYQETNTELDFIDSILLQPFIKKSTNVKIKVTRVNKIGITI